MKPINSLAMDKNAVSSAAALPETPDVFLVDDDPSVRRALARLIKSAGHQVQTFASAQEFLGTRAGGEKAACLVLDVRMPGITGIELQRQLQALNRNVPIVFMTGHGNIPMSVRAMREGAEDFLTKTAPKAALLHAIRRALARDAREREERARRREICARFEKLTEREREVLGHVVRGRLNKQIAGDLGIHERTVKLHRTNITTKLVAPSVAELTRLAHEAGLLP